LALDRLPDASEVEIAFGKGHGFIPNRISSHCVARASHADWILVSSVWFVYCSLTGPRKTQSRGRHPSLPGQPGMGRI